MTQELIDQLKQHIGVQGADINKLERQLFMADRTVAEQKETISQLRGTYLSNVGTLTKQFDELSALIEKIGEGLRYYYINATGDEKADGIAREALTAYESWKGKV